MTVIANPIPNNFPQIVQGMQDDVKVLQEQMRRSAGGEVVNVDGGALMPGSVTGTHIAATPNGVNATHISPLSISTGHIQTLSITAGHMTANSITVGNAAIQDLTVATAKIQNAAIETAKIGNLQVTTGTIQNLSVETGKIGALQVNEAKIGALAVETAKIQALAVETAKIADAAITTAKIGDAQITNLKVANIDGDKINVNTLTADRLIATSASADVLLSRLIHAGSLVATTGLSAVSARVGSLVIDTTFGGSIRVGPANAARIITDNTGITGYSDATNVSFKLAAGTGKVTTLAGLGGPNLLRDSSFESIAVGQYNGVNMGSGDWYTNDCLIAADASKHGTKALKYSYANGGYAFTRELVTLAPGTYTASVWVKATSFVQGTAAAYLVLEGASGTGEFFKTIPTGTYDWQRLSITFTLPTTQNFSFLLTNNYGGTGMSGTIWFDAAQIEEGALVTAYGPKPDEILPGTVTPSMLSVNNLAALVANIGVMTIEPGGLIRTGISPNPRVEIGSGGILGYSNATNVTFALDAATGKVTTLAGIGGPNLLRDSGFEGNITGRINDYAAGVRVTSGGRTGPAAWQSTANGAGNWDAYISDPVGSGPKVEAGKTYTFSTHVKCTSGTPGTVQSMIQWFNAAGTFLSDSGYCPAVAVPTASWLRQSITGLAPAGATCCRLVPLGYSASNGATFLTDDEQCEEGQILTAYGPKPDEILPNAVGASQLADNSVTALAIANDAVGNTEIATDAVQSAEIQANAIRGSEQGGKVHILADSIGATEIFVTSLSAITANMGTLNAGRIEGGTIAGNVIDAGSLTTQQLNVGLPIVTPVVNGNFQNGTVNWINGGGNAITVVTDTVFGKVATINNPTAGDSFTYQDVTLPKGRHVVTAFIKTSNIVLGTGQGALLNVDLSSGAATITDGAFFVGTNDWTQTQAVVNVTSASAVVRVYMQVGYAGSASGQAWWANFHITGSTTETQITPGAITTKLLAADAITADKVSVGTMVGRIPNGGFEDAGTLPYSGWTGAFPATWRTYAYGASNSWIHTTGGYAGTKEMTATPGAGIGTYKLDSKSIPVAGGEVWTVSAWMKTSGTGAGTAGGMYLRLAGGVNENNSADEAQCMNAPGDSVCETAVVPAVWTFISGRFVVPSTWKWAAASILYWTQNTGGTLHVDQVAMFKASTGTTIMGGALDTHTITLQSGGKVQTADVSYNRIVLDSTGLKNLLADNVTVPMSLTPSTGLDFEATTSVTAPTTDSNRALRWRIGGVSAAEVYGYRRNNQDTGARVDVFAQTGYPAYSLLRALSPGGTIYATLYAQTSGNSTPSENFCYAQAGGSLGVMSRKIISGDAKSDFQQMAVPAAKRNKFTAQTATTSTDTVVTLGTVLYDRNYWDEGASGTSQTATADQLICRKAGLYRITAQLRWAYQPGGIRVVYIRKNGTTEGTDIGIATDSVAGTTHNLSVDLDLVAGDYIELVGWQNSGIALNVNTGTDTWLSFVRLGAS